jgi:hypothetical protein
MREIPERARRCPWADKEVHSWHALKKNLHSLDNWMFRGQPNYHSPLRPSLVRYLIKAKVDEHRWPFAEQEAFAHFKMQAKALTDRVPAEADLIGWLTLMRHMGAPTRLLDWTLSFYVAAFFAYVDLPVEGVKDAALWCLSLGAQSRYGHMTSHLDPMDCGKTVTTHLDGTQTTSYGRSRDTHKERNRRLREFMGDNTENFLILPAENPIPRIVAQQGVFTCSGSLYHDLDEHRFTTRINPNMLLGPEEPKEVPAEYLRRIRLPFSWREEVLKDLWKMNINHASLFPGLDGLGRSVATFMELDIGWVLYNYAE